MNLDFLDLRVSEDGLKAEVRAEPRAAPGPSLRADDFGVWLASRSIVHGLIPEAIEQVLRAIQSRSDAWGPILIARGTPPVPGRPGRLHFHMDFHLHAGKLTEEGNRESAIDYRERGAVNNVREAQVLAERIPPTAGTPGTDVRGRPIAPAPGAKAPVLRCGSGVLASEDGMKYLAARDGNASLLDDLLSVDSEFLVPGDLDFQRGNVDFVGSVRINGSLKSGFEVKSRGDVHILKNVEKGSRIDALGSVRVDGALITGEEGLVSSGGDLDAGRLENARIRAGGDVRVRDEVRHSDVECRGRFENIGTKSTIRGSRIEAVRGIRCREVGTEDQSAVNNLNAGLTLRRARRLRTVLAELKELKVAREHVFFIFQGKWGSAATSRARVEELPPDKRAEFDDDRNAAQLKQEAMDAKVAALSEERNTLESDLAEDASAEIHVFGTVWPTTNIAVKEEEFTVRNKALHATGFALKDGRLVFKDMKTGKLISLRTDSGGRSEGGGAASPSGSEPAGGAEERVRRLSDAITTRKLTPTVLAAEIESFARDRGLAAAVELAKIAVKDKRYQITRIYHLIGRGQLEAVAKTESSTERRATAAVAMETFEIAVRKEPDHVPSLSSLAVLYAGLGKLRESFGMHERALRAMGRNPTDPELGAALYNYGATLMHLADRKNVPAPERAAAKAKAIEHIRRYLELFPEGPKAKAAEEAIERLESLKE